MIGLLVWKSPERGERQKRIVSQRCSVLQVRMLRVEILRGEKTPEAVLRRRVTAAAKRFRREGITEIVPPADFAYLPQLEKEGVRVVSCLSLARALAGRLVRREVERLGMPPASVRVAVCGEVLTGELVRTVRELALLYRYVLLEVPGGEELGRQLRREYGVSLLVAPGRAQLETADVTVLFSPREKNSDWRGIVLPLYEGAEFRLPKLELPPALEEQLPAGAARTALLAALHRCGAIRTEQICLET